MSHFSNPLWVYKYKARKEAVRISGIMPATEKMARSIEKYIIPIIRLLNTPEEEVKRRSAELDARAEKYGLLRCADEIERRHAERRAQGDIE